MSEQGKKTVVKLKYEGADSTIRTIDSLLRGSNQPDLVFVEMDSKAFPNRQLDLPKELAECVGKNPRVKIAWDDEGMPYDD